MKNGSSLPGAKMHSIPVPASRSSARSIQRLIVSFISLRKSSSTAAGSSRSAAISSGVIGCG